MVGRYLRAVVRHSWLVVVAVIGFIGNLATVVGAFPVPRWIWYAIMGGAVVVAQYFAYRDVARERDAAEERLGESRQALSDMRADRDDMRRARDEALDNALPSLPNIVENERIYLPDLARDLPSSTSPVVERRTFNNCELYGPALAFFVDCEIKNARWYGPPGGGGVIWTIPKGVGTFVGPIVFRLCVFESCLFEGIAVGSHDDPAAIDRIKKGLGFN